MKRILFTLLLFAVAIGASAQNYEPLPSKYSGSMMPYNFSAVDTISPVPPGYEPVHISYVARHGARYLSSRKKVAKIEKALLKAQDENGLSDTGKDFLAMIRQIADSSEGRWGLLSPVGIEEERRLGKEMASLGGKLLKSGRAVSLSTFVPRVIMTMYEFNHSLERGNENLELYTSSGHQNDSLLYCFDTFAQYREYRDSGAWEKIYDDFVARNVSGEPARRLFQPGYLKKEKKLRSLTMEMYGVIQGNEAAGFEAPTTRWMSAEEYCQCYRASNLKHYLRNTPIPLDPYCAPATAMLIQRIISDADRSLEGRGEEFSGYFGHCETLLPLLATLNVPGCMARTDNYETLDKAWKLEEITPLAANLMIIFMKDRSTGEICVALRLNGKNIEPWQGAGKRIVKWEELKQYWLNRLASFSRPKARLM